MDNKKTEETFNLDLEQALGFLESQGFLVKKTTAYIMNAKGLFASHRVFFRKMYFSKEGLLRWAKSQERFVVCKNEEVNNGR